MNRSLGKTRVATLKANNVERELRSLESERIIKIEEQISFLAQANKIQLELNETFVNKMQELENKIKRRK